MTVYIDQIGDTIAWVKKTTLRDSVLSIDYTRALFILKNYTGWEMYDECSREVANIKPRFRYERDAPCFKKMYINMLSQSGCYIFAPEAKLWICDYMLRR
jgi:hypothetical protein